jgi:hypothetical protein
MERAQKAVKMKRAYAKRGDFGLVDAELRGYLRACDDLISLFQEDLDMTLRKTV